MTWPMMIAITTGMLSLLGFDGWFFRELARQPDGVACAEAGGDGRWLLLPIGLAIVAFYVAKEVGYRRLGVSLALGVLALNAVAIAAIRLHMVRYARFARPVAIRLRWIVRAQAIGTLLGWAGVGWYLLS